MLSLGIPDTHSEMNYSATEPHARALPARSSAHIKTEADMIMSTQLHTVQFKKEMHRRSRRRCRRGGGAWGTGLLPLHHANRSCGRPPAGLINVSKP